MSVGEETGTSFALRMGQRGGITIPRSLRETQGLQPGDTITLVDLDGVFVLRPRRSGVDIVAGGVAAQWAKDGATLGSMLEGLREERETQADVPG